MKINRPKIPAAIERQVLIESGHRCAVCGESLPLNRAHIIPWHKSHMHKAEDLICLCANCHYRADKENWGKLTLREYKRRPWILRRYDTNLNSINGGLQLSADILKGKVQVTGCSQFEDIRYTQWQLWVELYLTPDQRITATIPIHRVTGILEISGLQSDNFDEVSLETIYKIPPDILQLLYGRNDRPKQIVVASPLPVMIVAYCRTLEWKASSKSHKDNIRFSLDIAESDYQILEISVPLKHLEYDTSTEWIVEMNAS